MKLKSSNRRAVPGALIAPCGMNCGLCLAFRRARNPCPGCRGEDRGKPKTRLTCRIKTCSIRRQGRLDFCIGCRQLPCEPLLRLDQRYRAKYGMSMLENLGMIAAKGLPHFLRREHAKWTCPACGQTLCVHQANCLTCKRQWQ